MNIIVAMRTTEIVAAAEAAAVVVVIVLPIGPIVVPFWGSYFESYEVIPKELLWGLWVVKVTVIVNDSDRWL